MRHELRDELQVSRHVMFLSDRLCNFIYLFIWQHCQYLHIVEGNDEISCELEWMWKEVMVP
jgi:hypothetical protein